MVAYGYTREAGIALGLIESMESDHEQADEEPVQPRKHKLRPSVQEVPTGYLPPDQDKHGNKKDLKASKKKKK